MNHGKEFVANFCEEINSNYFKSGRFNLIKRTSWILPQTVLNAPITGACTFYTNANKSGKAGYKSQELNKVQQSTYSSVQKLEL